MELILGIIAACLLVGVAMWYMARMTKLEIAVSFLVFFVATVWLLLTLDSMHNKITNEPVIPAPVGSMPGSAPLTVTP